MRTFDAPKDFPRMVASGRFELERSGQLGVLQYAFDGSVLELIHTEVPRELRGMGMGSLLAQSALEWARKQNVRVDVVCPFVATYLKSHPEYSDLVMK